MAYYIGDYNVESILGVGVPRFFYGLRKTDDGELYLGRLDQLNPDDVIEVNQPGTPEDNYNDFEVGIDFLEGRDVNHDVVYDNLTYEQYRWDNRNLYYYIDDDGQLVVRISEEYVYPTGI
jgi:hypothetical protein